MKRTRRPLDLPASPRIALLASVLVSVGVASCGPKGEVPLPAQDDLYAYSQAVARRSQGIVADAAAARALFHRGRVEQRFGYGDNALELYRRVIQQDPNMVDAYVQTGLILSQRTESHPQAIQAFEQALRVDPERPGIYTRLGLIYLHQDKRSDAEKALREEIRRGSPSELTYYNLGQTLALEERHEEAVACFQQAVDLSPTDRMSYYGLSQALRALGRHDESRRSLEEFRRLKTLQDEAGSDPAMGGSNRDRQLRWTSQVWLDSAVLFLEAMERAQDPQRRRELDREYLHAVEESLRFDPKAPEPREALVSYYEAHGDPKQAAVACLEALGATESPALIRTAYNLASATLTGLTPEAPGSESAVDLGQSLLERIVEAAPAFADARRELAHVYLKLRPSRRDLVPRAVELAQKAVEIDPNPRSYDILALALFRSGNPEAARSALEDGLQRNPEDEQLRMRLELLRGR